MSDPTRPDSDDVRRGPDLPDPRSADPWLRELCPTGLSHTAEALEAEGELLLRWLVPWAESVDAALDAFEAAVEPHRLSDENHRLAGVHSGVLRLHALADRITSTTARLS